MRARSPFMGDSGHFFVQPTPVLLAALMLAAAAVPSGLAQNAAQLISTRAAALPLPAGGNGDSVDPQISPDGRFVLFNSTAGNLTPSTGGQLCSQVFLRDRASNTTTLVSVNLNGFGGNGNSTYGGMYAGRALRGVHERCQRFGGRGHQWMRATFLCGICWPGRRRWPASPPAAWREMAFPANPVMSPHGRYVAFLSTSTNLAVGSVMSS